MICTRLIRLALQQYGGSSGLSAYSQRLAMLSWTGRCRRASGHGDMLMARDDAVRFRIGGILVIWLDKSYPLMSLRLTTLLQCISRSVSGFTQIQIQRRACFSASLS